MKTLEGACLVLCHPIIKIAGHTNVDRAAITVCDDVNGGLFLVAHCEPIARPKAWFQLAPTLRCGLAGMTVLLNM
jgi:hypothetical protein